MSKIDKIIEERGLIYGSFESNANTTQDIKYLIHNAPKFNSLEADQVEALEMIAHKISRILNGNPHYADSWDDIAGYAKLVSDRLTKEAKQSIGSPDIGEYKDNYAKTQTVMYTDDLFKNVDSEDELARELEAVLEYEKITTAETGRTCKGNVLLITEGSRVSISYELRPNDPVLEGYSILYYDGEDLWKLKREV